MYTHTHIHIYIHISVHHIKTLKGHPIVPSMPRFPRYPFPLMPAHFLDWSIKDQKDAPWWPRYCPNPSQPCPMQTMRWVAWSWIEMVEGAYPQRSCWRFQTWVYVVLCLLCVLLPGIVWNLLSDGWGFFLFLSLCLFAIASDLSWIRPPLWISVIQISIAGAIPFFRHDKQWQLTFCSLRVADYCWL